MFTSIFYVVASYIMLIPIILCRVIDREMIEFAQQNDEVAQHIAER